jgi:NADP-dependent 3-hydroxy acid dehydrogenase YdfG
MNNTIFITGASSGIGREVSKNFLQNGWNVVATARRLNLLKSIKLNKKEIIIKGGKIIPLKLDVTNKNILNKKITEYIKKNGVPDIIFLNAGTNFTNDKTISSSENTRKLFEVNFFGVLNCVDIFLPYLKRKKKQTQLIIMSSVAGYRGLPYSGAYCSSKAALINYAESIVNQSALHNIKVRVVNPGFIKTPLTDKNEFNMPLIITSDKAGKILYKKFLYSTKFEINLPNIFCIFMKFLRVLPYSIYFKLTKLTLKKL